MGKTLPFFILYPKGVKYENNPIKRK